MERVLVPIDSRYGAWEALSHAHSLAGRLNMELHILLIQPVPKKRVIRASSAIQDEMRKRLMHFIENAKTEGITVNHYVTEGDYTEEVISFAQHNKITLVIHETRNGAIRANGRESVAVRTLRHRIPCRMEVVFPKSRLKQDKQI